MRKIENINLLRARDATYHIARKINSVVIGLAVIPVIYSVLSNITGFKLSKYLGIDRYLSERLLSFLISVFIYSLTQILTYYVKKYKEVSNNLRELYDCKVFKLPVNKSLMKYNEDKKLQYCHKQKMFELYPIWYGETFCDLDELNVLTCQADNIIYTNILYKRLNYGLLGLMIFLIALATLIIFLNSVILKRVFLR